METTGNQNVDLNSQFGTIVATPQGGYSEFQVTGMIEWGQKSIPKKIPRASNKTQKNPWTKNLPQKNPMPKFRALISRKD